MTDFKKALVSGIAQAYPECQHPIIEVTRPDEMFGDFSTAIALRLASQLKISPLKIAQTIVGFTTLPNSIKKIEVIAPGYINAWLDEATLIDGLAHATDITAVNEPETILVEFGQPNTHKVPHIGHLYSYIYGESICRLLQSVGHTVFRANYQGDIGLHVAKCLWGYPTALKHWGEIPTTQVERIELLQSAYQLGAAAYDQEPKHKREIETINTKIYHNDSDIIPLWDETRSWSLAYYRWFENQLGIKFDRWYLESETSKIGETLVRQHVGDIFKTDDRAIIFRGQDFGLHTRVFINSRGNPTYEAKDVGLMAMKLDDFANATRLIVATANEQSDYWQVIKKTCQLIFDQFKTKHFEHIGYGMINLTGGKMSSRTGDIVTAFSLIEMVTKAMRDRLDNDRHNSSSDLDMVATKVGLGAIKYSLLKTTAKKNIAFDVESSVAKEGNSGPYLMYVYARCQSLLKKGNFGVDLLEVVDLTPDERAVLRWLSRYSDAVHQAVEERSPHYVANYLFELAQRFNLFYHNQSVLQAEPNVKLFRLALVSAVSKNIAHGLHLLGVEVVSQL